MRNSYKARVVREVLREDKTLSQVAAAHGLHPNLVSQWRDQALAGLTGLFSRPKESDWVAKAAAHEAEKQLYAEIGRLTTQLSWLKKKLAHSVSRGERLLHDGALYPVLGYLIGSNSANKIPVIDGLPASAAGWGAGPQSSLSRLQIRERNIKIASVKA